MNKINYPSIDFLSKTDDIYSFFEEIFDKYFFTKKEAIDYTYCVLFESIKYIKYQSDLNIFQNILAKIQDWIKNYQIKGKNIRYWNFDSFKDKFIKRNISYYNFLIFLFDEIQRGYPNYTPDIIWTNYQLFFSPCFLNECSVPKIQIKYLSCFIREAKKIRQFNITSHNNSFYEKILKQIINSDYQELEKVDKLQAKDIIIEHYGIEIDCFDFMIHKTIQREFIKL